VLGAHVRPGASVRDVLAVAAREECESSRSSAPSSSRITPVRVTSVGDSEEFRAHVDAEAERRPGVAVEHLSLGEALLAAGSEAARFDVVVADGRLYGGFTDALSFLNGSSDVVARGWLPEHGAGVFVPATTHDGSAAASAS